jgi:formylmethanofuran dehydrogenase subunit C
VNHRLVLRQAPPLRVDARALAPLALAEMSHEEVGRLRLPHGRDAVPVAEWFDIQPGADEPEAMLVIEGDLSRFDAVGAGLLGGTLEVRGAVGDAAGLGMTAGRLVVQGDAGDLAGCALRGGRLEIMGDTGDFAASALPGAMEGMCGGAMIVRGSTGARLCDRMRRGLVLVHGDAGDFAGSRMVAGTVAIGARGGIHPGFGMCGGTLLFAGPAPSPGATFVPVTSDAVVFWQLLARHLACFGGAFEALPRRAFDRYAGDLAARGRGELLFVH